MSNDTTCGISKSSSPGSSVSPSPSSSSSSSSPLSPSSSSETDSYYNTEVYINNLNMNTILCILVFFIFSGPLLIAPLSCPLPP